MKFSVITPTRGSAFLSQAIQSVSTQTYKGFEHIIVVDGADAFQNVSMQLKSLPADRRRKLIVLPDRTGANGYLGHRIYGASAHLAAGDWLIYLDEDNFFDRDHLEKIAQTAPQATHGWVYSMRKVVDVKGNLICKDQCESLGIYPSILADHDYFVDTNCMAMSREVALYVSPLWFRKARVAKQISADRAITWQLHKDSKPPTPTGAYTVNYRVRTEDQAVGVKASFFLDGNAKSLARWPDAVPFPL